MEQFSYTFLFQLHEGIVQDSHNMETAGVTTGTFVLDVFLTNTVPSLSSSAAA